MGSDYEYHSPSPEEKFSRRLTRSLENRLYLVHHTTTHFFILGATGNVYTVTISTTPTCNCPDPTSPCKHILFFYLRVLNLHLTDPCLRAQTLSACDLTRLMCCKVSQEVFASGFVRDKFVELYDKRKKDEEHVKVEHECKCTVCLQEIGKDDKKMVKCRACNNIIHEGCVMGKEKWIEIGEEGKYINLKMYLSDDSDDEYEYGYSRRRRRKRYGIW